MSSSGLFLGDQFFAWMMLAFGGAMLVGNGLAMVRKPADAQLKADRPPRRRTVPMMIIGAVVTLWALASILISQ